MNIREQIFNVVTDTPCKQCEFWDRQGHYCFLKDVHKDTAKCALLDVILSKLGSVDLEEYLLTPDEQKITYSAWLDCIYKLAHDDEYITVNDYLLKAQLAKLNPIIAAKIEAAKKEGYKLGVDHQNECLKLDEERLQQEGREEVAEWIKGYISMPTSDGGICITGIIAGQKWQAQLQKWGIGKPETKK